MPFRDLGLSLPETLPGLERPLSEAQPKVKSNAKPKAQPLPIAVVRRPPPKTQHVKSAVGEWWW